MQYRVLAAYLDTGILIPVFDWRLPSAWEETTYLYAFVIIFNYILLCLDLITAMILDPLMILVFIHVPFLAKLLIVDIDEFNGVLLNDPPLSDKDVMQTLRSIIAGQLEFNRYVPYNIQTMKSMLN